MKLPYLHEFTDDRGKVWRYVRPPRGKGAKRKITVEPDDPAFMPAYREALTALGLTFLPNQPPTERLRAMHLRVGNSWQHWQIARPEPGARWRRVRRTKCIDELSSPSNRLDKTGRT